MLLLQQKMQEDTNAALKKLRAEMEAQHQTSILELKATWTKEKESEIQQKISLSKAAWKEEMEKVFWSRISGEIIDDLLVFS